MEGLEQFVKATNEHIESVTTCTAEISDGENDCEHCKTLIHQSK